MTFENVRWADADQSMISATLNGDVLEIPADSGNRHYKQILDEGVMIAAYQTSEPTKDDVKVERDRRLALGFDYDFGDVRGVHRIGTTSEDMTAWTQEVTPLATARSHTNDTTAIAIKTETGGTQVTGAEWLAILEAAAAVRQPIWSAYFTIKDTSPVPMDYAADTRWPR